MRKKPFDIAPVTFRSMPFWCVGNPLSDPFGGSVLPKIDSLEVARILADAAQEGLIEMTSFHDDDLVAWDPKKPEDDLDPNSETSKKLKAIKKILDDAGLKINMATCSLHSNTLFRDGGLTNPDPKIRKIARKKVERTIRIGAFFGAKYLTYWVARDGFEVPVAVDWKNVYSWLADALNGAYDYIKANKFTNYAGMTIEPKPNEPRGDLYFPTTGHMLAFIETLDHPEMVGVNPEFAHESMAGLNFVHAVAQALDAGKLFHIDLNDQAFGRYDQDFRFGAVSLKNSFFLVKLLEDNGYKGSRHFDAHAYRTENYEGVKDFARGCMRSYLILKEKVQKFNTDAEIQGLLKEINQELPELKNTDGKYTPEKMKALKDYAFDRNALSDFGMKYEKLDQLTNELLWGIR
mgnify:CR=1 FL=1